MIDRRLLLASAAAASAAPALAHGQGAPPPKPPPLPSAPAPRMQALMALFGNQVLDRSPETATLFGLDKGPRADEKRRLDDRGLQSRSDDHDRDFHRQQQLRTVDRAALAGMDAVNYDTVAYVLDVSLQTARAVNYGDGPGTPYVLSQLTGAYQSLPDFLDNQHAIHTADDADAYLARLNAVPAALDGDVERAKHDAGVGCLPPGFAIDRALDQLHTLRNAPAPTATLVQSLVRRTRAANIPGDWERPATAIYEASILPALDRTIGFLDDQRKHASPDAGVWRLPYGADYYALSLKAQTSTGLTPDEVHRTGLALVADLSSQLDAAFRGQGLTQGTPGQRLQVLFADPRFLYPDTDAGKARLIANLNVKVGEVQARLPQWFGVTPKAGVQIKRVPPAIEAGASSNYVNAALDGSRPGTYYVNLRDTAEDPRWLMPTLTFHEAIPGHHLQISIAQEAGLPFYRQTLGFNAYVEGWALYAEQLGGEMGMYDDDPFGRIGYLHDAQLRAVRLVLDTGLHHARWTRARAIAYFTEHLGDPESAAATEVERYCVWPGQACGYMVGKLDWLKNRAKARAALGPRFDIRRFHDAGLTSGAMPLAVLDGVYDRWIAAGG